MIFKNTIGLKSDSPLDVHLYLNPNLINDLKEIQTVYKAKENSHLSISFLTNIAIYNLITEVENIANTNEDQALIKIKELSRKVKGM